MKQTLLMFSLAFSMLVAGCSKTQTISKVNLAQDGMAIQATISPSHGDGRILVGRVSVHNVSGGFVRYGNRCLYLVAQGSRAMTRVRRAKADVGGDATQIDPMADTKMIELAPGDSVVFASTWKYESSVAFAKTPFTLAYVVADAAAVVTDSAKHPEPIGVAAEAPPQKSKK